MDIEQLNIEGKRSGKGFVAHKATLVSALLRALADRVVLMDLTIGRKGFLGYLKALGGSNVIKVIPSNGSASGLQTANERLKVICGANTSYLADNEWIGDKTPMAFCAVRVSPSNSVKPNVGTIELADALARVLPFTAKDDDRPVLQCVNFVAKDKKLMLVSADGFRLAVVNLDYEDGEGQALIHCDDLKGVARALRKAKRARVSFEVADVAKPSSLIIDTELIRYKWLGSEGNYPEWQKLIPTDFTTKAHFDTVEAIKAVNSLLTLAAESSAIDITIGNGWIVLANPDDKGQAELLADTDGNVKFRIDGGYFASVLKACGGMVDLSLKNASTPMLFRQNGFQVTVMPMLSGEALKQEQKAKAKAEKAKPVPTEQATPSAKKAKAKVEQTKPVPTEQATPSAKKAKAKVEKTKPAKEPVATTA